MRPISHHSLNAVCPYYTMFPIEFPLTVLRGAKKSDWVLDPFCGRGTTNYAARLLGLPSVGVDASPIAVAIAKAKFARATPRRITELCRRILCDESSTPTAPRGVFWRLCYDPQTLREIAKLRDYFQRQCKTDTEIALRALLLGTLHGPTQKTVRSYLSNQMPRTYATKPAAAVRYWTKHDLKPKRADVLDVVERRATHFFGEVPAPGEGLILHGDSLQTDLAQGDSKFSWVITSPPYRGLRTYVPDQWLRNWFLGGPAEVSYDKQYQLPHGDTEFTLALAEVWARVAAVCKRDARMAIRFGSLPSVEDDPRMLIKKSLKLADAGWTITTIKDAGSAAHGRRQSPQFGASSTATDEIDVYARLGR